MVSHKALLSQPMESGKATPFSPYLFLLCAKGMLALLRKAKVDEKLKGSVRVDMGQKYRIYFLRTIAYCFVKQKGWSPRGVVRTIIGAKN